MTPLEDPTVAAEVASFSPAEKDRCLKAFTLFLEDGLEEGLASRNAVATILHEQRFGGLRPTPSQYRELFFWYEEYKKTMSDEAADNKAWSHVMKKRQGRK